MDEVMISRATELLQQIEQDGLSRKEMAYITGYSYQQTCKFLNGESNPTTDFLNRLFVHTEDIRIIDLITHGCHVAVIPIEEKNGATSTESLKELLDLRQHELDREKYLMKIIADGKIDESDRQALNQFNAEFSRAITHAYAIHRAVNKEFELATKGKK